MANIFTQVGDWMAKQIASYLDTSYADAMRTRREYYEGKQKQPLKVKIGQADDNLTTNLVRLAVDRSTSMLFGGGMEFVYTDPESNGAVFLKETWDANKKNLFLHRLAVDGEIYGTAYIKIVPDGLTVNGRTFHRLVLVDPYLMAIECDPMDVERVTRYVFEVKIGDTVYREVTRRAVRDDYALGPGGEPPDEAQWVVEYYESNGFNAVFRLTDKQNWPYEFPPILHIQNLPSIHSPYGVSGIEGCDDVQDKYNFVVSNILKIIRYHAHPKTWGAGINSASEKLSWGADELIKFSSPNARLANLEMQSDLASSISVAHDLRQALFDLARVVDISTLADKAGQLTDLGIKVLWSDPVSKNSTRRLLYGDGLTEINRRLLALQGIDEPVPDIHWGADVPTDEAQDAKLILDDLAAGIVSKETASTLRGHTWEGEDGEREKIFAEAEQARQQEGNVGGLVVRDFLRGRVGRTTAQ